MKIIILSVLLAVVILVKSDNLFAGTNFMRVLVHHQKVEQRWNLFQKVHKNVTYTLPALASLQGSTIQGILAYDLSNTKATASITSGGLGCSNVTLFLSSEKSERLNYDIYIYA